MLKFLIIDDRIKNIHFLAQFLKREFPDSIILSALNGKEGIEIAKREKPSLILLDLLIPGMDGLEILNFLKNEPITKNIPVIVLTAALKGEEHKNKSLLAGADFFIQQPEDINQLIPQIHSLLRHKGLGIKEKETDSSVYKTFLTQEVQTSRDREKALREALEEIKKAQNTIKEQNIKLKEEIEEKNLLLGKLRESEKKYRLLFESDFNLIFLLEITDNAIKIDDVNAIALQKLGYSRKEILQLDFTKLYDNEEKEVYQLILKASLGKTSVKELIHKRKDGSNFIVEATTQTLTIENKKIIYLRERDVTKENEMLEELKTFKRIIDLSPISVIITDIDGKAIYVNQNHLEITGYSEQEILGEIPCILDIENHDTEFYNRLWNILRGGDVWTGEFKNRKKNGEPLWVLSSITPLIDKEGILKNFAIISLDITGQKKLIEELKIAKAEAEKSDRLKSEFLSRISHEIRTPINTIINFTQILFEEISQETNDIIKISKNAIIESSRRIQRTIDLIVNMAQIEAETIKIEKEEFDLLKECIQPLIEYYSYRLEQSVIDLELKVNTGNARIVADKYTVEQIFSNVIDNAIKFNKKGGKITIDISRNEKNNLIVSVQDTGIGISKEYLPHIFEPFTQEESGYSRNFEGPGLGMALVKKYCELNNAQILVNSVKGKGTTVKVIFQ